MKNTFYQLNLIVKISIIIKFERKFLIFSSSLSNHDQYSSELIVLFEVILKKLSKNISKLNSNQVIENICVAINQSKDIDCTFNAIANQISSFFSIPCLVILNLDLTNRKINHCYQYPNQDQFFASIRTFNDLVNTPIASAVLDWQSELALSPDKIHTDRLQIIHCKLFHEKYDCLIIPIIYQLKLIGILILWTFQENLVLLENHAQSLTQIATVLGIFLENQNKSKIQTELENQIDTFQEIARILSSVLDPQQLLELILDQIKIVVPYNSASIMLIDNDKISIAAHRGIKIPEQLNLPENLNNFSHLERIIETREPCIIHDTLKHKSWLKKSTKYDIRSWMGVPLIGKDKIIGILNLDHNKPNFYTSDDASLAITFANQATISIENANLHRTDQKLLDQMRALRQTITDISSELDLPKLLRSILERAIYLLSGTGGDLSLYDAQRKESEIVVSINIGKDYVGTRLKNGEGAIGTVVETHEPLIISNYHEWEKASPQYKDVPWYSVIAAPFLFYDKVIGAISVINSAPDQEFTKSDKEILSFFGQHAAIAVENARLFEKEKRAAERSAVLHKVSQQIVAARLDSEEIYHAIHQAVRSLMPADAFVINILEESGTILNPVYLFDQGKQFHMPPYPSDAGLTGRVIKKKESSYISDLKNDPRASNYFHYGRPQHVRSILVVPMWRRGEVIGALSTQSYQPHAYQSDDQYLLEMLASYAAIALDNTQMFVHIQELAITDSLTGLYNRRHLFELGQREFLRAQRLNRPLSIIMIDIDHFKIVNDTYGHLKGDEMLRDLAQLIKMDVREIDIVGRFGGEEFTIILPETNAAASKEIAERIRNRVQDSLYDQDNEILSIRISLGIAELESSTHSFDAILEHADRALYDAKYAGKNQSKVYRAKE
jgi:diguanylate cyclase (GGDEF)-like protein